MNCSILAFVFAMASVNDIDHVSGIENEYKHIYKAYFNTIRTRVTKGRLKTMYHFLVAGDYTRAKAKEFLAAVDLKLNTGTIYKINAAFGFILRNHRTNELRFFHPSQNNMLYDLPVAIKNRQDLRNLLDDMESEDAKAYAAAQRPSTVWRFEKIVCVRFDLYKAFSTIV